MKFTNDTRSRRRIGQRVFVRMARSGTYALGGAPVGGVVIQLDLPGQPPGVEVLFDHPVNGLMTCYATYDEVRSS